ncbi:MAG: hypothetical protein ACQES7_12465, partial [Pseudomonadota bacterium]
MNFEKGNALYRQGAYEQAASYYIKALEQLSDCQPCYVNLALALRKIGNKAVCDQILKSALAVLRPGKLKQDLALVKKSRLVNAKWYLVEHAIWLPEQVDPILHYLAVGWQLGLNPCKRFDNNFYLESHRTQMRPGDIPLLHYLYQGK